MGQSIKQRPIEGVNGAPANHRATRKIVNYWLSRRCKNATCSVRPNWCHRARVKMLIIWVSSMYICVLRAVIFLREWGSNSLNGLPHHIPAPPCLGNDRHLHPRQPRRWRNPCNIGYPMFGLEMKQTRQFGYLAENRLVVWRSFVWLFGEI